MTNTLLNSLLPVLGVNSAAGDATPLGQKEKAFLTNAPRNSENPVAPAWNGPSSGTLSLHTQPARSLGGLLPFTKMTLKDVFDHLGSSRSTIVRSTEPAIEFISRCSRLSNAGTDCFA
jgi:hypothetical protein